MSEPERERMAADAAREGIDEIIKSGPSGGFAVAGVAVAAVFLIYFAFYVFIYLPRGIIQ